MISKGSNFQPSKVRKDLLFLVSNPGLLGYLSSDSNHHMHQQHSPYSSVYATQRRISISNDTKQASTVKDGLLVHILALNLGPLAHRRYIAAPLAQPCDRTLNSFEASYWWIPSPKADGAYFA
jgi:hypothetical protein